MLLACRDDAVPLYVVGQGKTVRKRGERLEVWSHDEGKISEARIREISNVCLYGGVEITTPGDSGADAAQRAGAEVPSEILDSMERLAKEAEDAMSLQSLLGIEGAAAEAYFGRFGSLLKLKDSLGFSYLYGILTKVLFVTVLAAGFDPYLGFYHQPRYGRPALALDMMEEFRPIIADSVAITLFNNREFSREDFIRTGIGISLKTEAKKTVIAGYEDRMHTEISHPIFGYSASYRRILEIQSRLLARVLSGELDRYPALVTR